MLNTVMEAAVEAGKCIIKYYKQENFIKYKYKDSPFTIADKLANETILDYLTKTIFPVLSEEGKSINYNERKSWASYWLIDPLDGTKEFINQSGEFTVNIALIERGVPVLGVVYAPVKQWLYIGIEGEGAWKLELENHSLPKDWKSFAHKLPLNQSNKKSYTVVGSKSHASKETDEFISTLEDKYSQLDFISMGSSLKICLVAEGRADIYPRLAPTMEWDTAAGDAIARSAGCKVVSFKTGEPLQYNKENLLNPWFIVKR